jgi:hypothetical protein
MHPGASGFIVFSEVAFNRDLTEALFYTEFHCGSLCAEEKYVLMRKVNGRWVVQGQSIMGVAMDFHRTRSFSA